MRYAIQMYHCSAEGERPFDFFWWGGGRIYWLCQWQLGSNNVKIDHPRAIVKHGWIGEGVQTTETRHKAIWKVIETLLYQSHISENVLHTLQVCILPTCS